MLVLVLVLMSVSLSVLVSLPGVIVSDESLILWRAILAAMIPASLESLVPVMLVSLLAWRLRRP